MQRLNAWFQRFAQLAARALGSSLAFMITVALIGGWLVGGLFGSFTDSYQLLINTVSTLVTSIYVVLVQNTQHRDARALHLKIDELLTAVSTARTRLVGLEEQPEAMLTQLHDEMLQRQQAAVTEGEAQ